MIQVLQRAANVIEALNREGELSLKALVAETALKKPTLWVILNSLAEIGYVQKTGRGRYAMGPKLQEIALGGRKDRVLRQAGLECAGLLSDRIHENVIVAAAIRSNRHTIAKTVYRQSVMVDSQSSLQYRSFYETATGRVLLAFMDRAELDQVMAKHGLPGNKWPEAGSARKLTAALAGIKRAGLVKSPSDDGQALRLAFPVKGPDGAVWAALGVSMPVHRFRGSHKKNVMKDLRDVAEQMSQQLSAAIDAEPATR